MVALQSKDPKCTFVVPSILKCFEYLKRTEFINVCYENKYTKRSSVLLLCLVYLFSEQTLVSQLELKVAYIA
jgi:hypothetical protein